MRAHILSTSAEMGSMLQAGLATEGGQHHVTVDTEVSTARRPIPLDVDLLIADLDHPCMPPAALLRRIAEHPAAKTARVVLLTGRCGTARRLLRNERWAVVVHSLRDLIHLYDTWIELLAKGQGPLAD